MPTSVLGQGSRPASHYVLNLRNPHHRTLIGVRVDRTTRFGNPFVVGVHGVRGECCKKHAVWLDTGENFGNKAATEELRQWVLSHIQALKGQYLFCWCAPEQCHGETLAERANGIHHDI